MDMTFAQASLSSLVCLWGAFAIAWYCIVAMLSR
jgi:hypothetical protein